MNHSAGPTSTEGKAASSRNALKHGMYAESILIPGEDPEALDQLRAGMHEHWDPRSLEEHRLVERHIYLIWTLRRLTRVETEIWTHTLDQIDKEGENRLARAFSEFDEKHLRLQRLTDAKTREDNRLLDRLQKLIAARPAPVEEAQVPAPSPSAREFVSSNHSKDEPSAARPVRPHGLRGTVAVRLVEKYAPKLLGREATRDDFDEAIAGTHPLLDEIVNLRDAEWQ